MDWLNFCFRFLDFVKSELKNLFSVLKIGLFCFSFALSFYLINDLSAKNENIPAMLEQSKTSLMQEFDSEKLKNVFLSILGFLFSTTFLVFV